MLVKSKVTNSSESYLVEECYMGDNGFNFFKFPLYLLGTRINIVKDDFIAICPETEQENSYSQQDNRQRIT